MYGNIQQYIAMYNNIWQYTTIYSNVQQCTAMRGNQPISVILPSTVWYNLGQFRTIWYCNNLYYNSKEGRKEKYIYGYSNCIVVGY